MPPPDRLPRATALSLSLGLVVLAVALLGTLSPVGFVHLSDAYPVGLAGLRACPLAVEALGPEPAQTWGWSRHRTGRASSIPWAWFDLSVAGARGRGRYHFAASREASGWTLAVGELTVAGRTIDIARCADATPALPPAFASVAALPAMPVLAPGAASGLAVLASPPPGLTGPALAEHYCRHGLPAVCAGAALAYLHGAGVAQDTPRARELLDLGCQAGRPDACSERAKLPAP